MNGGADVFWHVGGPRAEAPQVFQTYVQAAVHDCRHCVGG